MDPVTPNLSQFLSNNCLVEIDPKVSVGSSSSGRLRRSGLALVHSGTPPCQRTGTPTAPPPCHEDSPMQISSVKTSKISDKNPSGSTVTTPFIVVVKNAGQWFCFPPFLAINISTSITEHLVIEMAKNCFDNQTP